MFYFKVEFWDELLEKDTIEEGFLAAPTYVDATERLCQYYGKENIIKMTLSAYEDLILRKDIDEVFKYEV